MPQDAKNPWWSEEYGFFGNFYMDGDASQEGYLIEKKQSLKERTVTEVVGVVKLLSLKDGASVLDCPCGYGRHSIELARQGFEVVGSDINSVHLQKAIDAVKAYSLNITFSKESMLDLQYSSRFDGVINMFYSFGFFDTDEENEKVLKNFFNALKPGGKFLMHTDVNVPRILSGKYKEDEQRNLLTGKTLRIIDSYDPQTKRINGAWIIQSNGKEERKDYSVRVYTKEEFEEMCRKVGFSSVVTYSGWEGGEYSENAEDMIVVATK
ncbi:MAG: class I SAM-dependent methyltransferase [Candidatus Pacebacteria bacterium]|nr:class I SAM-dependent methyltransferase [Candidatus Paceibacterota bacterium]MCF7862444.1 class I SAM-dependent methyltransferase [Candidatus Paceibacterota bacterium]